MHSTRCMSARTIAVVAPLTAAETKEVEDGGTDDDRPTGREVDRVARGFTR